MGTSTADPRSHSPGESTDIEEELERALNGVEDDGDLDSETASGYEFDREIKEGVVATADTIVDPKEAKMRNAVRIHEIADRDENQVCADCGAAGELDGVAGNDGR